jgi:hypothetical protein
MKQSLTAVSAACALLLVGCDPGSPSGPGTQTQIDSGSSPQPTDSGTPAVVDSGQPETPDAGEPAKPDSGQPVNPDSGQPGTPDSGQPVTPDAGQPSTPDSGQPGKPDSGQPGTPDAGQPQPTDDPQLPDTTSAATIEAWIAKGYYKTWKCEAEAVLRRGAHGKNRICSNDALSKTTGDQYPVGSVGFKELYDGTQINGYALEIKKVAGTGPSTWFWYERLGTDVYANSLGDSTCTPCHSKAKDFVYTRIE